MLGWVIYNGHLNSKKFIEFGQWIKFAAQTHKIDIELVKNNDCYSVMDLDGPEVLHSYFSELPDFVVFLDKDIALAKQFQSIGVRIFNSPEAIDVCDNKITMYQRLSEQNIAIPKTIIAPKTFFKPQNIEWKSFIRIGSILNYPLIIKEAYGSYGDQVYLIQDEKELKKKIEELVHIPLLFQEYISENFGKDRRIYVVGDKVIGAIERISEKDFRANVELGSTVTAHVPSENEIELSIRAAKAVGASFAGIDLLTNEKGEPIVCEVNTNAHIKNIYDCTGENVAEHLISFIVNDIEKNPKN